jgi:hypothetical protein
MTQETSLPINSISPIITTTHEENSENLSTIHKITSFIKSSSFFHIVPAQSCVYLNKRYQENDYMQFLERYILNPLGYWPFLGAIAGSLRIGFASLQLVSSVFHFCGLLLAYIAYFFALLAHILTQSTSHIETPFPLPSNSQLFFLYMGQHAILNFIRGFLEIIPFMGLVLKNYYDMPEHRYGYEKKSIMP